jgi:tyrosyl-tRNA synthetase
MLSAARALRQLSSLNSNFNPQVSSLPLEARYTLCMSVAEECIQPHELKGLLSSNPSPLCYDGFEPSGRMHIAQGLLKAAHVNRLAKAGCTFTFWIADWFAMLNHKLGGDLGKIHTVGLYMAEVWKAAGMDLQNVKFLWASEEINSSPGEYWMLVMDIARKNNLARVLRCAQIMGRQETDDLAAAQVLYPCMQCADIFFLKADICQLGMDQRKVNVLAREYCDEVGLRKPVILSHHMLAGLQKGQEKMSKSKPDSAIFMDDSTEEVNKKIRKAFCEPGVVDGNPVLDYVKHLVFGVDQSFTVPRQEGDLHYTNYLSLETDFISGSLHPSALKPALATWLNSQLQPVREHFQEDSGARELMQTVKTFQVTR